jgi:putative permease
MKSSSASRWIKTAFSLLVIVAAAKFLIAIGDLVKLVVIGALLAYILDPLASFLEARGLSRMVSTAVIFLCIIIITTVFIILLLPSITDEIKAIRAGFNNIEAARYISNLEETVKEKFYFLGIENFNFLEKIRLLMIDLGNRMLGFFINVVSLVTNLLIIPFIMFFLLKDGRKIKKELINLIPNRYFELMLDILHKIDLQLGNYLRGQLLDSLVIGALSIIALWTLDVKYFYIIGIFTGLANMVPFIGPIFGAVPAVLVAVLESGDLRKALYVVLAFVVIQLIDNGVVKPVVVAKAVNMHPLVVLLAVIIGGKFFGILGMILSVPAFGIIKVAGMETFTNFRKYHFG